MKADIDKYIPVSRTDINIDKGIYSNNLGLSDGYAIERPYADFILVEYIDIYSDDAMQTTDGLYIPQSSKEVSWRKGKVLQVGPYVRYAKVGELVTFPYDKGLPTNRIKYINENGEITECKNAIFVNEARLFATLKELNQ